MAECILKIYMVFFFAGYKPLHSITADSISAVTKYPKEEGARMKTQAKVSNSSVFKNLRF